MSNTLSKCLVSHDPLEIDNIINSDCFIVKSIDLLNENQVMIVYDTKTSFVVENDSSNVIVSLWTSSTARVTLYRSMDKVINTPSCFLAYTDTDSLVYEAPEHLQVLPIGNFLGDLTNETKPHEIIIEVVVGGSKQYATAILNTITNKITYNLKLRGITLNAETSTKLHYEKFKQMVLDGAKKEIVDLKYTRIAPSRLGHVYSKTMMKQYKVVYKKGNIGPDFIVYPFGYKK
uniref:Uncharacterized protein n=1 Tax=Panagrolaimus sp. PS1159 TaxID=55785 RepID=A0AC35FL12_9BILA